jgi:hypothetical protein
VQTIETSSAPADSAGPINGLKRRLVRDKGKGVMRLIDPMQAGGLAALLAGVLLILSDLLRLYIDLVDPALFSYLSLGGMLGFGLDGFLGLILAVLMQLGLVGLYARQAQALGIVGLIGLVLATFGVQLSMGSSFVFAFIRAVVWPWETGEYFEEPFGSVVVLGLGFVLGCILLGVAMMRDNLYSRVATAFFIVGAVILLFPLPLNDVVFGGAIAWLGYTLLGEGSESMRTG